MSKRHVVAFALALPLLGAAPVAAQVSPSAAETGRFAGALRGGNLGLGLDVLYGLAPQFDARVGASLKGVAIGSLRNDAEWTANALVDWTPKGLRGFRLTGGLGYLDIGADVTSDMGKVAAYAGIGWSSPALGGSRWRLLVDAGSYYRLGGVYREEWLAPAGASGGKSSLDAPGLVLSPESRFTPTVSVGASFRF